VHLGNLVTACGVANIDATVIFILDVYVMNSLRITFQAGLTLRLHRTVPIAYSALLMILALIKGSGYWKLNGFTGSKLIKVIILDQFFYYGL
jgi:hypothetical protein